MGHRKTMAMLNNQRVPLYVPQYGIGFVDFGGSAPTWLRLLKGWDPKWPLDNGELDLQQFIIYHHAGF